MKKSVAVPDNGGVITKMLQCIRNTTSQEKASESESLPAGTQTEHVQPGAWLRPLVGCLPEAERRQDE